MLIKIKAKKNRENWELAHANDSCSILFFFVHLIRSTFANDCWFGRFQAAEIYFILKCSFFSFCVPLTTIVAVIYIVALCYYSSEVYVGYIVHCYHACICIASIHRNTYNYGRSMDDYGTSMMFYFFFSLLLLTLLFDTETNQNRCFEARI